MPQLLLPFLSSDITYINGRVTVYQHKGEWTYFLGDYPIYSHRADDHNMFRLAIAQLIKSGSCRQLEIIKAFGVSKSSVIRAQNKLKKGGSSAFFKNNRGRQAVTELNSQNLSIESNLFSFFFTAAWFLDYLRIITKIK